MLNETEQEIIALLAQGKTTKQIALARKVKGTTVRTQLSQIYETLGVAGASAAVAAAFRKGYALRALSTEELLQLNKAIVQEVTKRKQPGKDL